MTARRPGWLAPLVGALHDADRLAAAVALRPGVGARGAAVLVLVGDGPLGPEILFVERASGLRTHAGQIAFPGGAVDKGDEDFVAAALREADEEVGLDRSGVEILGALPPAHVAVSGFDVTAVVGWWRTRSPVRVVDPREVASVVIAPVAELADPANRYRVRHPSGHLGPAFQVGDHLIWGLTGHLLDGLLTLAGWQRPWDTMRTVGIPDRYLTDRPARPVGGHDAH